MSVVLIAHASHWLVNVSYVTPLVAFLAWLGFTTLRERRGAGRDPAPGPKNRRERRGG